MATRKGGKGSKSGSQDKGKGVKGREDNEEEKYAPGGLPTSKASQRISLSEAVSLTQRYRKASPASEHGGFFWANGLREVLAQPGCVGIRYYHGLGEKSNFRLVIVGVDANGEDIVKVSRPKSGKPGKRAVAVAALAVTPQADAVILDQHWPCPPFCPPNSPLN